ncbi:hypothetical protein AX14_000927 [Amanita brunnescens Koide BX004]|nr:hypothetical protein AX14_000927 [Amanita brunnescens Koide BX004]
MSPARTSSHLDEQLIQDSFHSYLRSSLAQAKAERLLDEDVLSSAQGDLMITGPALCLYFAALRSTTNPPSVPLPRNSKGAPPMELSFENCPPAYAYFLRVWAEAVPKIQDLPPEYQHDLARIICNLQPITQPVNPSINGISADIRAVAIEISQRRSFQDRYASDLQAALDAGEGPRSRKVSFVPPPMRSISPSILAPESPAIEFIRETLYAALGDVLERHSSLRRLLKRDPSRAYFAAVAFAIFDVATTAVTADGTAIVGVLGTPLRLEDCPNELRPFMQELVGIGAQARELEQMDNDTAMQYAQRGDDIPEPILDRVKVIFELGVGQERERGRREGRLSVEGRSVTFSNRINALSLAMTKLRAFKERQDQVFKILSGIGS